MTNYLAEIEKRITEFEDKISVPRAKIYQALYAGNLPNKTAAEHKQLKACMDEISVDEPRLYREVLQTRYRIKNKLDEQFNEELDYLDERISRLALAMKLFYIHAFNLDPMA